jgi:hypothetical protein
MDIGTFFGGVVVGFFIGALVFTVTGREVTGVVARATGERIKYHVEPKR